MIVSKTYTLKMSYNDFTNILQNSKCTVIFTNNFYDDNLLDNNEMLDLVTRSLPFNQARAIKGITIVNLNCVQCIFNTKDAHLLDRLFSLKVFW